MDDEGPFEDIYLGDIAISVQTALKQAKLYFPDSDERTALIQEIVVLFVHSLLHLLGYDHMTPTQRIEMSAKEKEILTVLFPKAPVPGLTAR
jgi:probable rRNA maturation factor